MQCGGGVCNIICGWGSNEGTSKDPWMRLVTSLAESRVGPQWHSPWRTRRPWGLRWAVHAPLITTGGRRGGWKEGKGRLGRHHLAVKSRTEQMCPGIQAFRKPRSGLKTSLRPTGPGREHRPEQDPTASCTGGTTQLGEDGCSSRPSSIDAGTFPAWGALALVLGPDIRLGSRLV